jgi:AraC family transcriptional regulator
MAVLPAGWGPAVRLATSCDVTVYGFAPNVLKRFREELDGPRPPELESIAATRDSDLLALLHLLDRELGLGEPSGKLYAESLAFALLARAVALSSHQARTLSFDASPLNVRTQARLFEFIEANLHRNLGLEELALQVGYGRGHFLKTFRATTGTSPHQYLLDRRVERAKALLRKRSTPLVEIATACGFSSQSHFTSEFRRRVGVSPARYRRLQ